MKLNDLIIELKKIGKVVIFTFMHLKSKNQRK